MTTETITIQRTSVRVGTLPAEYGAGRTRPILTIDVELTNDRLSISADLRRPGAFDIDAGGQMDKTIREALDADTINYASGWTAERLRELLDIWARWHLNDMRAECEHQRAGVAVDDDDVSAGTPWNARPIDPTRPTNAYGRHYPGQHSSSWNMLAWVRRDEHPHGLLSYPCPTCGYKYGSAWLTEEIPADVRAQLVTIIRSEATS